MMLSLYQSYDQSVTVCPSCGQKMKRRQESNGNTCIQQLFDDFNNNVINNDIYCSYENTCNDQNMVESCKPQMASKTTQTESEQVDVTDEEIVSSLVLEKFADKLERFRNNCLKEKPKELLKFVHSEDLSDRLSANYFLKNVEKLLRVTDEQIVSSLVLEKFADKLKKFKNRRLEQNPKQLLKFVDSRDVSDKLSANFFLRNIEEILQNTENDKMVNTVRYKESEGSILLSSSYYDETTEENQSLGQFTYNLESSLDDTEMEKSSKSSSLRGWVARISSGINRCFQ